MSYAVSIRTYRRPVIERGDPYPERFWAYLPDATGGGGPWVDAGCHQIDLLDFYLEPWPRSTVSPAIYATSTRPPTR